MRTHGGKHGDRGIRVAEHGVKVERVDGLGQVAEVALGADRPEHGVGDTPGVGLERGRVLGAEGGVGRKWIPVSPQMQTTSRSLPRGLAAPWKY